MCMRAIARTRTETRNSDLGTVGTFYLGPRPPVAPVSRCETRIASQDADRSLCLRHDDGTRLTGLPGYRATGHRSVTHGNAWQCACHIHHVLHYERPVNAHCFQIMANKKLSRISRIQRGSLQEVKEEVNIQIRTM